MSKYYKVKNTTNLYLNSSYNCTRSASLSFVRTSGGAGYTFTPNILIANATGDNGFGASVSATLSANAVSAITTVSSGQNYSQLPTLSTTGIIGYTALNAGSGYTLPPFITATGAGGYGFVGSTLLTATGVGSYTITAGGSGYTNASAITFNNTGTNGTGAVASITTTNGYITGYSSLVGGSGYGKAPTITASGGGTGFSATAYLNPTSLSSSFTITNGGTSYITGDEVIFNYSLTGGGNGTVAKVIATNGVITGVNLINPGFGYTLQAPSITVRSAIGSGAVITGVLVGSSVAGIVITNPGSGYITSPAFSFTATNGGTGASATPTITNGVITGVSIAVAGSGYTAGAPTITSIAGGGTGANISFFLTASTVASIVSSNAGYNYPASGTTFNFTNQPGAGGSGASATPTITPTTSAVITPSFLKTISYTWENIPSITINDFGKLTVMNLIANTMIASTSYTFRIKNIQYTSKDIFNSDYGDPLIAHALTTTTAYSALANSLYSLTLTPQNISSITVLLDDSITTKNSGVAGMVNFVIVLQIDEFDPETTEINDVYRESATRLRLNY